MATPKRESIDQAARFEQAARELGVELDEEKLKEALRKIAPEKLADLSEQPEHPAGDAER